MRKQHIVISGAGFAGLTLARKLNNRPGIRVTLIEQYNFHQFQPLLYQVASAGLDAGNISFPLRKIFQRSNNTTIEMGKITRVLPGSNLLVTSNGILSYDILVLATGCSTNFFGNDNLRRYALPMKSTYNAIGVRNKLLQNLEALSRNAGNRSLDHLYNIVIAGGGPTGVELSGAFAELRNKVLPKDYPGLDCSRINIYLLEKGKRLLPSMSEKSGIQSEQYLTSLGVHVICDTGVTDFNGKTVILDNDTKIQSGLLIWAAGISGNIPDGIDPACINQQNRLYVDGYSRVKTYENIYAVGDVSIMSLHHHPDGHPQVCKVANDQGSLLAKNLLHSLKGKKGKPFRYKDLGTMATVGRNKAVVDGFPFAHAHFKGWIAWMMWMGFHLYKLLGVKNKIQVFVNWAYKYFTYDQNLRLIIRPDDKDIPELYDHNSSDMKAKQADDFSSGSHSVPMSGVLTEK
ncbi:MAG: NAD(P)/FAD-dependent oxidoreductase [Bacteroidetes bacterium]|nr:NAD(P)/FAD-dependent oxidoreductase [Bacteroidota bacterium]